jgi:hypothetical protein
MGAPVTFIDRGRRRTATHLISTIAGNPGRVELLKFARAIGLREQWLQRIGSEFEHFDLFGKKLYLARAAGAKVVDRRRLIEIVRDKREARTGERRRRAYAYARAVQRNALRATA